MPLEQGCLVGMRHAVILNSNKFQFIFTVHLPSVGNHYKWFKANVGQTGFYRVNYNKKNWDQLEKQLHKNHKARLLIVT